MNRFFSFVAACGLLLAPGLASAGVFEGKVSLGLKSGRDQEMIIDYAMKDGLVRMEPRMAEAEGAAMIFNLAKLEMTMLMAEQRMYMVMPLKAAAAKAVNDRDPGTAKLEKTGKTETILGYVCEQYIVTDKSAVTELWVTDKLGTFMGTSGANPMAGMMGGGGKSANAAAWEEALKGKEGFFPLRVIAKDKASKETFRLEAKKIEPGSLPASLFEPPAGFQKLDMSGMGMGGFNPFGKE